MPCASVRCKAEPVHAGIDMDGRAARPAGTAAEHVPFGKLIEIADHRFAIDAGEGVAAGLEEAVEDIDGSLWQRRPRSAGFIERGDEKRFAAGAGQRTGDRIEPAAIGVRLDHAGAIGRHGDFLQLAPVGDDGVEIDGQDPGGRRGGSGECRSRVRLGRQYAAGDNRFGIGSGIHAALYEGGEGGSTRAGESVGSLGHMAVMHEIAEPRELALELTVRPCRSDRGAACR